MRDWAVSQKTDVVPFSALLSEPFGRNIYARNKVALFAIFNRRLLDMRRAQFFSLFVF